jgi:hypothetical protein
VRAVLEAEATLRVRVAAEAPWPARQSLPGCRSAYHCDHYLANKKRYVDQARARKQALALERTTYLLDYFEAHPCADCRESDPIVLEFDHLDAKTKSFDIGQALPYRKWQSILEDSRSAR